MSATAADPARTRASEADLGLAGDAVTSAPSWWRRAPVLSATAVALVGLLVQTGGYALGWWGHTTLPVVLFYVGLVVVVAPYAAVLLGPSADARQRRAACVAFGLVLYGSWVLADPIYTGAFDETLHVATLADLAANQGWFATNAMLPVSPHYPGLELATVAVHWLTGLPLVACEVVVVALSRTALVLCLFHLTARICRSARAGGVVVLLYATSVQFWFFNAQFSYQTLALSMVVGALWLLLRACEADPDGPPGATRLPLWSAQLCLVALALTHHLSSWIGVATVWALAAFFAVGRERRRARLTAWTALVGTVAAGVWSLLDLTQLRGYLGPVFDQAGSQLDAFLNSDGGGRQPLTGAGGNATPYWESAVMAVCVLLWCLMLLPATLDALRGRTLTRTSARVLLVLTSLTFPVLFLTRFVPAAAEIGERASTFVSLAAALVVGSWLVRRIDRIGTSVVVPALVAMIVGGVCLGSGPDWQKVPGPYLAGAEQRSVDSETMAVAQWAGRYLPAGSTFASDTTMSRVLPTVAPVQPVTSTGGSINVTPLFVDPTIGAYETGLIRDNHIDFVVVDRRFIGQEALSGCFYEGSCDYTPDDPRITAAQLDKFAHAPGFRLVLDGPVQVYDVRSLWGGPSTFADRPPPGLPGRWYPWQVLVVGLGALATLLPMLRRRWAAPGSVAGTTRVLLSLPLLMVLGAIGTSAGFSSVSGTVLGLVGVAVAAGHTRALTRSRLDVDLRAWVPWAGVLGVLAVGTTVLAVVAARHGLFDHAALPAPPSAGGSTASTASTVATGAAP